MHKNLSYPYNLFVDIYGEPTYGIESRFDCTVCAKLKELIETDAYTTVNNTGFYSLSEYSLRILLMHYRDKLSYREMSLKEGYKNNIDGLRQVVKKSLRVLNYKCYRDYIGLK